MKCIREKQQKRKKDDHLSASYLWLTRAQNFDHASYKFLHAGNYTRFYDIRQHVVTYRMYH